MTYRSSLNWRRRQNQPPPLPNPTPYDRRDDCSLSANADVLGLWGSFDAQDFATRMTTHSSGGPGNIAYRDLISVDGDTLYSGERAELGHNEHRYGLATPTQSGSTRGTFWLYQTATYVTTKFWVRMSADWPITAVPPEFANVCQMKQCQPSSAGGASPQISLQARRNQWELSADGAVQWTNPNIALVTWYELTFDITYTKASSGTIILRVHKLGDDPTADLLSGTITCATLKTEISPGAGGLVPGDPVPGHLRVGPYHATSLGGMTLSVADVRITVH